MTSDLSILVLSCDKFSPAWPVFYSLFQKYWPEYDGDIYHYSESKQVDYPKVININSQLEKGAGNWSAGLLYALEKVNTPHVILMLEDFFLNQKVKHDNIMTFLGKMKANTMIKCLRLVPIPAPDQKIDDTLGKFSLQATYRNSTQMAIWDKQYLKDITKSGESPWDFEHKGSVRSANMDGEVWGVLNQPMQERTMTHVNGIIRGKLTKECARFLKGEGIAIPDIPLNSALEEFYWFGAPTWMRKILDFINTRITQIMWKNKL